MQRAPYPFAVIVASMALTVLALQGCAVDQDESRPAATAAAPAPAYPAPESATAARFAAVMDAARANGLAARPIGDIMQAIGESMVGTPYEAGTLDRYEEEQLVVGFMGFDCVTFVESVLAMARGIRDEAYDYTAFAGHLADQRYRDGQIDGYCSRLHYFTDWIADNERRSTVRDITAELGGARLEKRLDFMTTHRDSYPLLAENDSLFLEMQIQEERLKDQVLYIIPQDRIREAYDRLQAGDIVALATDIEGLDVVHTGLVYAFDDGRKGLLHASVSDGVTVSPDIQSYVENNRRQIGIVVARPR